MEQAAGGGGKRVAEAGATSRPIGVRDPVTQSQRTFETMVPLEQLTRRNDGGPTR